MTKVAIGVVTNPNSKKNRARLGRAAELQQILGARGVVRETHSVQEIEPVVREFRDRGIRYWVSDGGDGALHWLVNEARATLMAEGLSLPLTVPTNGGTIDFVAKKVGIRGQADEILKLLVEAEEQGRAVPVEDVPSFLVTGLRVERDGVERSFEKIGFTAAVAGVGQRFFDMYYLDPSPGPGTLVKIIAKGVASIVLNAPILSRLPLVRPSYREYARHLLKPQRARVEIDGEIREGLWRALHVGSIFVDIGGVVRLFPLALGGKLHVMLGNPSMPEVLLNLHHIFTGRPMRRFSIEERSVGRVAVEAQGDELLAPCIDGEIFRDVRRMELSPGPLIRIPRVTAGS